MRSPVTARLLFNYRGKMQGSATHESDMQRSCYLGDPPVVEAFRCNVGPPGRKAVLGRITEVP